MTPTIRKCLKWGGIAALPSVIAIAWEQVTERWTALTADQALALVIGVVLFLVFVVAGIVACLRRRAARKLAVRFALACSAATTAAAGIFVFALAANPDAAGMAARIAVLACAALGAVCAVAALAFGLASVTVARRPATA